MQESINAGFAAPTILIDYATAARQPFPSPHRPSISLLASSDGAAWRPLVLCAGEREADAF